METICRSYELLTILFDPGFPLVMRYQRLSLSLSGYP